MKKRIMIVDDNYDTTYSLKTVLEDTGLFQVDGFTNPVIALSNFKPGIYNLVILEIGISPMDGLQLYRNLKEIDREIAVCFLTSVSNLIDYAANFPDIIDDLERGKIDCYIDKPVGSEQLVKQIQKKLDSPAKV